MRGHPDSSPLDVQGVNTRVTVDEIVSALRESRERESGRKS
jgi:hypothetical protein